MPNKKGNKVLRSGMNANRPKPMSKMNASRQKPVQPQLVRNIKTGEVAQYIPDKLQPTIPKGWVPTNASRRGAANASRSRSNAFVKDGSLIVQRRGNEYRILNSNRKVVAKGRLNSGRQSMNCGADYDPRWNEWYDFLTPEEMETYAVEQGADPGFIAEEGEEVRRAIGEGVAGYLVAKPELNNPAETDLIVTESGMVGNYTHEDPRNRRGLRFFPYDVDEILDMSGVDEDF